MKQLLLPVHFTVPDVCKVLINEVDEHANIMTTPISPHADLEYIPEMQDLPISVVNYCMYREPRL
jgi:hypothetical protein